MDSDAWNGRSAVEDGIQWWAIRDISRRLFILYTLSSVLVTRECAKWRDDYMHFIHCWKWWDNRSDENWIKAKHECYKGNNREKTVVGSHLICSHRTSATNWATSFLLNKSWFFPDQQMYAWGYFAKIFINIALAVKLFIYYTTRWFIFYAQCFPP